MSDFLNRPLKLISDGSQMSGGQLRLGYDEDNYLDFRVDEHGDVEVVAIGDVVQFPHLTLIAEAFSGDGNDLTNLAADALATGTVPLARLAGLTAANLAPDADIAPTQLEGASAPAVLRINASDEPEWGQVQTDDVAPGDPGDVLLTDPSGEANWSPLSHELLVDRDANESHPASAISLLPNHNAPLDELFKFLQPLDAIVPIAESFNVTVRSYVDARRNRRAVGSVVGVLDDSRASTPDGAVCFPASGVSTEILTGGNVTALNALQRLTMRAEFVRAPGITAGAVTVFLTRQTGATGATRQAYVRSNNGLILFQAGDGTVLSSVSCNPSIADGVRYRVWVVYDGTLTGDTNRVRFWVSSYNPLTDAWTTPTSFATSVVTAGVPAQLLTLANASWSVGNGLGVGGQAMQGIIGGNGDAVRVWFGQALTEAQIIADAAADTPVIATDLRYRFSGPTPYANLGSAGAVGDLTPSANVVLCSGDRRFPQYASPGAARPTIASSPDRLTLNGTAQYLRNVSRGGLEGITGACALVWVGTMPTADANRSIVDISTTTQRGLQVRVRDDGDVQARTSAADGAGVLVNPAPTGVRVLVARRTNNTAGNTALRIGTGSQSLVAETPEGSGAITRVTIGANRNDTPADFANGDFRGLLVVSGTNANVHAFCDSLLGAQWGAGYHVAEVF